MNEVTQVLSAIEQGDQDAAERLLPLVYEELRQLAARRLAHEKPGQTLQATALVHEAYLRLVEGGQEHGWDGRAHFFAAAAEAMRRILVDRAVEKRRLKHGGDRQRLDLDLNQVPGQPPGTDLLDLDDALTALQIEDPAGAALVKLRLFAGLSQTEAAAALGLSPRTAARHFAFARAWLFRRLRAREE